jgi:hypothetical protein
MPELKPHGREVGKISGKIANFQKLQEQSAEASQASIILAREKRVSLCTFHFKTEQLNNKSRY